MKQVSASLLLIMIIILVTSGFKKRNSPSAYSRCYFSKLDKFREQASGLVALIQASDLRQPADLKIITSRLNETRRSMKQMDFWMRYLEPSRYKQINGPLPVEWETEVFEKFEKPYRKEGAGLTLAALYLQEDHIEKDSLQTLAQKAVDATATYQADSITRNLSTCSPFFLSNRLYLLNLAAIYTTGFECPDSSRIIPEVRNMLKDVTEIYDAFNEGFSATSLTSEYLSLYANTIEFVNKQPDQYSAFDHYQFIKNYINPLFRLNQQMIRQYKVVSKSFVDYTLNKTVTSIFSKEIYKGQNAKGIYLRIDDAAVLAEIENVGKLLFYDPILSGNNQRSCASCHQPNGYFTDSATATAMQFNGREVLKRNTPSLINVVYNHLVMLDGKHISLQDQTKAVLTNPIEMGGTEKDILKKVLSCPDYKKTFKKLLAETPGETEITIDHITSAITLYYGKFSRYSAPFDYAINNDQPIAADAKKGFNLFMSKAQCATCHFVPQFNGVKPPYVGSEFEVLGVPQDTGYRTLSEDKGRYQVNPAVETLHAFRTGSLRNMQHTAPYMHNGVFKTMEQVIDFYDAGGGTGKGLTVTNQTLSADSLHLTPQEKKCLIAFMQTLNESIVFEKPPVKLPASTTTKLNTRKVGGSY
jgi:cytochrome c peroxidase